MTLASWVSVQFNPLKSGRAGRSGQKRLSTSSGSGYRPRFTERSSHGRSARRPLLAADEIGERVPERGAEPHLPGGLPPHLSRHENEKEPRLGAL